MTLSSLPNILTLSRIPIAILAYLAFKQWDMRAGLILFIIGFISDWIDGNLARRYNCQTDFGKLLDPVTDKFLVLIGFLILSEKHIIPYWIVILIAIREIYFTAFRIIRIKKGFPVIPAGWWGKVKTTVQMFTLGIGLSSLAFNLNALYLPCLAFAYLSLILTYYSGLKIWQNSQNTADCL